MKVRYAGKVYEVNETRVLPGGIILYGIEDEPGHIDFVSNVQVIDYVSNVRVLEGSTYNIKEKGLPYPKSPIKFDII